MSIARIKETVAKGVLAVYIVFLAPLFIYAAMSYFGIWDIKDYRLYYRVVSMKYVVLEIATIMASFIMLKKVKMPFLVFPIAFSVWFLSMDITEMVFGSISWEDRKFSAVVFGLVTLYVAYFLEKKYKEYSFWLYIFGTFMFWSGLSLTQTQNEMGKFFYFVINVLLLFCGIKMRKKVFLVFGTLGVAAYLGHLSWIFRDSFWFVSAVSFTGLLIVIAGVNFKKIENTLNSRVKIGIKFSIAAALLFLAAYTSTYLNKKNKMKLQKQVLELRCKNKRYELKRTNTSNGVKFVYKNRVFDSLSDFKSKYCK